jgi:hypothetical protein
LWWCCWLCWLTWCSRAVGCGWLWLLVWRPDGLAAG